MVMEGKFSGPVNIGNPDERRIEDLALMIRSKINKNLNITYKIFRG